MTYSDLVCNGVLRYALAFSERNKKAHRSGAFFALGRMLVGAAALINLVTASNRPKPTRPTRLRSVCTLKIPSIAPAANKHRLPSRLDSQAS